MARKKDKLKMPSSTGGLVKYFGEYETKFEVEPKLVILVSFLLIIGVIILQVVNPLGF